MVSHLLQSIPPEVVYLIVGLMIMVESLGIPVPGEIALVTAAVLATQHKAASVAGLDRGLRQRRGDHRGLDRLPHRTAVRRAAVRLAGPQVPAALRPGTRGAGRTRLHQVWRLGRVLRPVHRAAADPRRAAGRVAAHAVLQVPGRQRLRRDRLGHRDHVPDLVPGRWPPRSGCPGCPGSGWSPRSWSAWLITLLIRRKTATLVRQAEAEAGGSGSPGGGAARADNRGRRRPGPGRPSPPGWRTQPQRGQAPGAAARRVASTVSQGRPGGSMNVTTLATWSQGSSCSRT